MPVKNGELFIYDAIRSILLQTYRNFELIIVDDGSVDSTLQVIRRFEDVRIKLIVTDGIGLVEALNKGLENADGYFVARMDADDISLPNRFEEQLKIFQEHPSVGLVCSDIITIDDCSKIIGKEVQKNKYPETLLESLTYRNISKPIIHPTVMIKTELLKRVGGYRNYVVAEDKDLWLRLLAEGVSFYRINQQLLKYRKSSSGVSRTKINQQRASSMLAVLNFEVKNDLGVDLYLSKINIFQKFNNQFLNFSEKVNEDYVSFMKIKRIFYFDFGHFEPLYFSINLVKGLRYYFFSMRRIRKTLDMSIKQVKHLLENQ